MGRSVTNVRRAIERYNANEERVRRAEERLRRLYAERARLSALCFAALPSDGAGIIMGERYELSIWSDGAEQEAGG